MTDHDDPLTRALHDLPTGTQRSLESIERRAATIRNRRHTAGAGLAVVAAGVIAVPAIAALTGAPASDPLPGATVSTEAPEPLDCKAAASARRELVSPAEVPGRLRLLWGEDAAPPPEEASSLDIADAELAERLLNEPCEQPRSTTEIDVSADVVTIEDGVITRVVRITGPWEDQYLGQGARGSSPRGRTGHDRLGGGRLQPIQHQAVRIREAPGLVARRGGRLLGGVGGRRHL